MVVKTAAVETNLSKTFTPAAARHFARLLNEWYISHGYVASRVVEPIAPPLEEANGRRLFVRVAEGKAAPEPVVLNFFRPRWLTCSSSIAGISEMASSMPMTSAAAIAAAEKAILAPPRAEIEGKYSAGSQLPSPLGLQCLKPRSTLHPLTLNELRTGGPGGGSMVRAETFNGTHVQVFDRVPGRTRPSTVATALGLRPGRPFRITPTGNARLSNSGLFREVSWRSLDTIRVPATPVKLNLQRAAGPEVAH